MNGTPREGDDQGFGQPNNLASVVATLERLEHVVTHRTMCCADEIDEGPPLTGLRRLP